MVLGFRVSCGLSGGLGLVLVDCAFDFVVGF